MLVQMIYREMVAEEATMNDLVLQLYGKYHQRPHPMHVGKALRRLGWKKVRDWSTAGEGRRFWAPNDRIDS